MIFSNTESIEKKSVGSTYGLHKRSWRNRIIPDFISVTVSLLMETEDSDTFLQLIFRTGFEWHWFALSRLFYPCYQMPSDFSHVVGYRLRENSLVL